MPDPSSSQTSAIRLTKFSHGAGCACKLGSLELSEVLRNVQTVVDPRILVDASSRDDAAVYLLTPDRAMVATVDFFMPIVDDAATWGRITATNALSDLYAMGATPLFALSLVGWPREKLPLELLGEVQTGMAEITRRAGCPIVGGHSIDSPEPHVGLVAFGEAHPDRLLTNRNAKAGDVLVLTKSLGTGILSTALKRELLTEADMGEAIESMTTLNDGAMRAALANQVRAATDVTGFGLLGHLGNIVRESRLGARIQVDRLPLLGRARELAESGVVPGGTRRNLEAAAGTRWGNGVTEVDKLMVTDAQTSGGLLLAVPPARLESLLKSLELERTPTRAVIGTLTADLTGTITVELS
jgi:selenide,water dikinase